MWKRSFVATSVALGDSLEDALGALGASGDVRLADLVERLRAPHRAARASALAEAIGEIAVKIEEAKLR